MAFHGNESQDRYKWYQSPHLGLSPAGYGGGISGGHYSHYPAYSPYTQATNASVDPYLPPTWKAVRDGCLYQQQQPSPPPLSTLPVAAWYPNPYGYCQPPPPQPSSHLPQPNPYPPQHHHQIVQPDSYSPPQNYQSALLIKGHLLPQQFPCISHSHGQPLQPPACSQPIYPVGQHPTHHSLQPNTNFCIYPLVSPISATSHTSHQQQTSPISDVKLVEPDHHLGSISREPDRVHGLESPTLNSGYSSLTPEPMNKPKESGSQLSPHQGSGELPVTKLCATGDSLKKSMDTFMSEFKEELRLLRDSWQTLTRRVENPQESAYMLPSESNLAVTEASTPLTSVDNGNNCKPHVDSCLNVHHVTGSVLRAKLSGINENLEGGNGREMIKCGCLGVNQDDQGLNSGALHLFDEMIKSNGSCYVTCGSSRGTKGSLQPQASSNSSLRAGGLFRALSFKKKSTLQNRRKFSLPENVILGTTTNVPSSGVAAHGSKGTTNSAFTSIHDKDGTSQEFSVESDFGAESYGNHSLSYSDNSLRVDGQLVAGTDDKVVTDEDRSGKDAMISGSKCEGNEDCCIKVFYPDISIWSAVLYRYCKLGQVEKATRVLHDVIKRSFGSTIITDNTSLNGNVGKEGMFAGDGNEKMQVISERELELLVEKWEARATAETQSQSKLVQWFILCLQLYHCAKKDRAIRLFCKEEFHLIGEMTETSLSQVSSTLNFRKQGVGRAYSTFLFGVLTLCDLTLNCLVGVDDCPFDNMVEKKVGDVYNSFDSWSAEEIELKMILCLAGTLEKRDRTIKLMFDGNWEIWEFLTIAAENENGIEELLHRNDKACDFGSDLFNILTLLIKPTLENQGRHLLVKVIDKMLYELAELGPYVHKILVVITLLINEDNYARFVGKEMMSKLGISCVITFSTFIENLNEEVMIAGIMENRQDVDNYLTWILSYWKFTHNGNQFNLHEDFQCHFSDYLSELVEFALSNLESYKCVSKEVDIGLLPLNSVLIASHYFSSGSKRCELMLGDISTALEDNLVCYCDGIMIQLLRQFSNSQSYQFVKPLTFSCLDDPQLAMILYMWEIKVGHKSMELFEDFDYLTVPGFIQFLLKKAGIALGTTSHGHKLHDQVLDFSTYAYVNSEGLTYDLGDYTLAALHSIDSTSVNLNTRATVLDSSLTSQPVNIADCPIATLLGSLLVFATLLICTIEFHISVSLVGRYGQVLPQTFRLEDKPVLERAAM